MKIDQLMSVTGCNTLKDLNYRFNFQLRHVKFDGVIMEECGIFESIEALMFRIEGLIKEGIEPRNIKVRILEKKNN